MANPGHASQPWEFFTLKHRLRELFPFLHCPSQPFGASTSSLVPRGPCLPQPSPGQGCSQGCRAQRATRAALGVRMVWFEFWLHQLPLEKMQPVHE